MIRKAIDSAYEAALHRVSLDAGVQISQPALSLALQKSVVSGERKLLVFGSKLAELARRNKCSEPRAFIETGKPTQPNTFSPGSTKLYCNQKAVPPPHRRTLRCSYCFFGK